MKLGSLSELHLISCRGWVPVVMKLVILKLCVLCTILYETDCSNVIWSAVTSLVPMQHFVFVCDCTSPTRNIIKFRQMLPDEHVEH